MEPPKSKKNALCGEFVSVLPESPQNSAVVVDTPDDDTVVSSKETVNQWLEEIEIPLEFETLLELNEVISDLNLGGVSPEPEGKIRLVTKVELTVLKRCLQPRTTPKE